jgi:hypothetical protein
MSLRNLVIALAVLAIAGCEVPKKLGESASIIDFDKELAALYSAKLTPGNAGADTSAQLAKLATRAAQQGDAAADNVPSAVSFYRIAATAAWAAGPPHDSGVPDLSEKGAGACAKLPHGDASQPRDCAVLKMAPDLALLDAKAVAVQKLRDASPLIPQASFDAAASLAEDMSTGIGKVLEARSAAGPQAESFEQYLKVAVNGHFCTLQNLVGRLANSNPPEGLKARAITAKSKAQASLLAASVPINCPI